MNPLISEISYTELDGQFFSYYISSNQITSMYSVSSSTNQTWYTQPVNPDTGILYGTRVISPPLNINTTTLKQVLSSRDPIASKGSSLILNRDSFINAANINGRAAVSVMFPVDSIVSFFTGKKLSLCNATLSIATTNGEILLQGLPNTYMNVVNSSISFQWKRIVRNNTQTSDTPYISCEADQFGSSSYVNIDDKDYNVFCSLINLAGLDSVSNWHSESVSCI